ncbi:SMP-30/gluconolaconase/LRE-like region family protein [Paenibacillus terrae HPL-003]|uniref:SMP-30/gluconolaconase/LRE-like region family protein n=1 Tax=Paenibacillus terrae (strain HPL-003) TaxID=985665 RepID=G7VS97_PAETH|nr:glycosyl hydrolase family 28-related protein [Paenibacillus terrae]AET61467.1 SMP-30/gluconolaconase/LRE-like region family protein [Paenibacillus terrae HPL-003]
MTDRFTDRLKLNLSSTGTELTLQQLNENFKSIEKEFIQRSVNASWFGAAGDGVQDDTAALQELINKTPDYSILHIPSGRYKITSTLQIRKQGIRIFGIHKGRYRQGKGVTSIEYYGTGPCFQIGDESLPSFSGFQNVQFHDLAIRYEGTDRASLNNPFSQEVKRGYYGKGALGIQDWKGGGVTLDNVLIEHFETAFWGYESDVDLFNCTEINYNKTGIHLQNRSSQFTSLALFTLGNDTALDLNSSNGARFLASQHIKDGSSGDIPIRIDDFMNAEFIGCWFEGLSLEHRVTVPSFIQIGVTKETKNVALRDSILAIADKFRDKNDDNYRSVCDYFVDVVIGKKILVDEVGGYPRNLRNLVSFSGSSSTQQATLRSHLDFNYVDNRYYKNNGTGQALLLVEKYSNNGIEHLDKTFVKAYLGARQNILAGSWQKVHFNQISYDEMTEFEATGNRWRAKQAGKYRIQAYISTDPQVDGNRTRLALHVNDEQIAGSSAYAYFDDRVIGGPNYSALSGTIELKLEADSFIDIRVFSQNKTDILPGGGLTYLTISRI